MKEEKVYDAEGIELHESDRVYTYYFDEERTYGTLVKNEFTEVSDWAVNYDDGESCAVLSFNHLWKA